MRRPVVYGESNSTVNGFPGRSIHASACFYLKLVSACKGSPDIGLTTSVCSVLPVQDAYLSGSAPSFRSDDAPNVQMYAVLRQSLS
jgi:hypothetical protein